jgi:serine/threonine-protein kinase
MTFHGVILGTAAYMAPEQARGKAIDKRADIWAFGCVLFEALTGRRAFEGDDISTTLAAVLKTDPDWQKLPPATPAALRRLVVRCLNKDPKDRLQSIGDARIEIRDLLSGGTEPATVTRIAPPDPLWRRAIAFGGVALLAAALSGAGVWFVAQSTIARPRVLRFAITPPSTAAFSLNSSSRDVAITPDGSRFVYIGANATTLFVRSLDQLEATPLVRGIGLRDPFVSPDSQWAGFFEGPVTLKKVALTGGPAVSVATLDSAEGGATWGADGTIIFATVTGLQRVSADGGAPAVLTRPDRARGEASYRWPERLLDGDAVLYTVAATTGGPDAASIAVLDLKSGRPTILLRGGSHAQYVPSGHLVYAAAGTLRAARFDPKRLMVVSSSSPVVPQVLTTAFGAVEAALARDGTLVYVAGGAGSGAARSLVWVDRQGRETPLAAPPRAYAYPRISPDGMHVAVTALDQIPDIWLWDLARETLTRVTTDQAGNAVWTPDGRRLVFTSNRAGALNLFSQPADGTGDIERLTVSSNAQVPSAVSPDGTRVVFTQTSLKTGQDVMALRLNGPHEVLTLVQTPFDESNGIVSPDGRWLAYQANESGQFQIYVRPFPDVNSRRWQVSTGGGTQPLWARSGHELFYYGPDAELMRVVVAGGQAWVADAPMKVLEGRYLVSATGVSSTYRNYDVAPDGQRFLMLKAAGSDAAGAPTQIVVVQHFDEELKRLVPTR